MMPPRLTGVVAGEVDARDERQERAELVRATGPARHQLEDLPSLLHVRSGERTDGARVFLPRATSLQDVVAITLRVDGSDHALRGRYFAVAEKRAIDARLRNAP